MQMTKLERYEKNLAKLYLYFLPFHMLIPFSFLNSIFIGLAKRSSFLFLIIGFIISIISRKRIMVGNDSGGKLFKNFILLYIIVDTTSILMALILYFKLGTIGGEDTFKSVLKKIPYTIFYVIFLYYNKEIFRFLAKEEIDCILNKIVNICLFLGLLQIGVLFVRGPFCIIYDAINLMFGAWSSADIIKTGRIALITIEPATIAGFFGIIIFPYIFSKWIIDNFYAKDLIKFILLCIVLYFTKSTTGYVLFSVDFMIFCIIYFLKRKSNFAKKSLIIILGIILSFAVFNRLSKEEQISNNMFSVFDKLLNTENRASMSRRVGLYINIEIFKNYPILGVGNGNQGFFYRQYFPDFAFSSEWATEHYDEAAYVVLDGGVFFGSFASGYGIIGVILLIVFLYKSFMIISINKNIFGYLYYFYIMSILSIIIYGFSSTLVGEYAVWFVLSLPLAISYWKFNVQYSRNEQILHIMNNCS